MAIYTNKEEKGQYGRVLAGLLKKKYPFILDVDVYVLQSRYFFEIDCYLIVPKDFILENIKSSGDRQLRLSIEHGIIPMYLFNDNSKGLKFKTEEFLKLSRMLFLTMFGEVDEKSNYSIKFKVV
jgi:hypothetical protein